MKWILPEQNTEDIFEWLLKRRNITDKEKFLNPKLEDLHDFILLHDSTKAAEIIVEAVKNKKKIFIHGDFDVDGITATTIMWDFLFRKLGADVTPYIPNRFDEGYGLSESSVDAIIEQGGQLIITVDCGVKDIELVKKYKNKIDFIITDHHTLAEDSDSQAAILPEALAVVHPKHPDGKYPFTEICGAMVSWKTCQAINDVAQKQGFTNNNDMFEYLDLVALGTVCDVMPLVDENRIIVKYGLERLKNTKNLGLRTMLNLAGVDLSSIDTYHLGFVIGPRLNAAGRIESALDAVRLLSTTSSEYARELAEKLNQLNSTRQEYTQTLFETADKQIQSQLGEKILFVHGEDWPEGVVGLIAGKLMQKYNKPVLVGSRKENIIKGSARSIEGFHISDMLKNSKDFLIKFGGHAGAAGFTLDHSALSNFENQIRKIANDQISEDDIEPKLYVDSVISPEKVNISLIDKLKELSPFGNANEQPMFALMNLRPYKVSAVGKDNKHIKILLSDGSNFIDSIGFGLAPLYSSLLREKEVIDVAGYFDVDEWNGNRKVSLKIRAIR